MGVYRSNGAVDHRETAPGAGSYLAGGKRAAHSELQRGGEAGGPARRLLRYSASSAGQHGDLRGGFCGSVPYFLLRVSMVIAATDRPGTRGARLADWQKRRRHRPPRSATTSFYHRQPPPPQTAPQRSYFFLPQTAPAATDRPAAQLLLLDGRRACRHRPPPMRSGLEDAERTAVLRSSAGKKKAAPGGVGRVGRGPGWTK